MHSVRSCTGNITFTTYQQGLDQSMTQHSLTQDDTRQFFEQGFLIRRQLMPYEITSSLIETIDRSLAPALAPVEFEADVHYPGAPASRSAPGGQTPRRLLHAFTRADIFQQVATHPEVLATLQALMESDNILLSQNHHNCVMTKHPGYSSMTSWHQDIRYWRFDRPELISTWLALGPENVSNGCLLVIPGSHKVELDPGRFDAALFLRTDLDENQPLLESVVPVELEQGDVLFFHSRTLHAAGQNQSKSIKRSLVYTYRSQDNEPIPETRSAVFEDIPLFQKAPTK
jgi:phytanoyl-CoA hydroxylase